MNSLLDINQDESVKTKILKLLAVSHPLTMKQILEHLKINQNSNTVDTRRCDSTNLYTNANPKLYR